MQFEVKSQRFHRCLVPSFPPEGTVLHRPFTREYTQIRICRPKLPSLTLTDRAPNGLVQIGWHVVHTRSYRPGQAAITVRLHRWRPLCC